MIQYNMIVSGCVKDMLLDQFVNKILYDDLCLTPTILSFDKLPFMINCIIVVFFALKSNLEI